MYTSVQMKTATFTEFRQNASTYLDEVEKGATVRILRHGKVIAELIPPSEEKLPSWKGPGLKLTLKGVGLSEAILEERKKSRS